MRCISLCGALYFFRFFEQLKWLSSVDFWSFINFSIEGTGGLGMRSHWRLLYYRAGTPTEFSISPEIQEFPAIEQIEPIVAEMQEISEVEVNLAPHVVEDDNLEIPEITMQPPNSGESQPEDADPEPESLPTLTRFYTCPLDQVVEELDQLHHDGASFSRSDCQINGQVLPLNLGSTWSRKAVNCPSTRPSTRS